ncbi:MAG TPA: hypothetical protein VE981_00310 [Planctomycetota bacterium]|nr:hypothetical protein [Planctomycetota bacterium]
MSIWFRAVLFTAVALALPACSNDPTVGEIPPDFALISPPSGSFGQTGTPTLSWSMSSGTPAYQVQIATDIGFTTIVVDQTGIATTSFTPGAALTPGTVYFWRVIAQRATGDIAALNGPFSFETVAPTPGPFTLTSPTNATTGVSLTPMFAWTASLGTATYRLQVATDAGFTAIVVEQAGLMTTSTTSGITLNASAAYFWRVIAESTSTVTATNAPFVFTTQGMPPGAFTMVSPSNGATGVSTLPTLTWNASSGAISYRVELSRNVGFTIIVVDQSGITTTSFTVTTTLLPTTIYFWRITAVNAGGNTMAVSSPFSFTTQ